MEQIADDINFPWVPATAAWTEGDVILWQEPVFSGKGTSKIGSRQIAAQVLAFPDEYVQLVVLRCEVTSRTPPWRSIGSLVVPKDTVIRRKAATIVGGHPKRLLWQEEEARDIVLKDVELSGRAA